MIKLQEMTLFNGINVIKRMVSEQDLCVSSLFSVYLVVDKLQSLDLVISFYPVLFPKEKGSGLIELKCLLELELVLVLKDLMCKLILGTGQLANFLKNINKTSGKFT